jgi:hypothetical protein
MRPSHPTSEFSSSPSLRREGRLSLSRLAQLFVAKAPRLLPVRDPYRGVALGVESAWPAPSRR